MHHKLLNNEIVFQRPTKDRGKGMSTERDLTNSMRAELRRNGIVASYQDYEDRKKRLISLNDGFGQLLDFIPDFIMIDLLKEYEYDFSYQNMDEFADGILNYKHGNVQVMRKIARHFFIFNPDGREFELDEDFKGFSSTQLEKMTQWSKQELMAADINPSMTVYEIDAKVRENGKRKSIRVTDDEYRIINAYIMANETVKDQVKKLLKL